MAHPEWVSETWVWRTTDGTWLANNCCQDLCVPINCHAGTSRHLCQPACLELHFFGAIQEYMLAGGLTCMHA